MVDFCDFIVFFLFYLLHWPAFDKNVIKLLYWNYVAAPNNANLCCDRAIVLPHGCSETCILRTYVQWPSPVIKARLLLFKMLRAFQSCWMRRHKIVSAQNTPSFADSDLTAAVGHFLSWWFTAIINCNTPYIHVGCKNYGRFAKRHFDFWLYWQKMSKGTSDQWQVVIAAFDVMNLSRQRNHVSSTLYAGPHDCFWATVAPN